MRSAWHRLHQLHLPLTRLGHIHWENNSGEELFLLTGWAYSWWVEIHQLCAHSVKKNSYLEIWMTAPMRVICFTDGNTAWVNHAICISAETYMQRLKHARKHALTPSQHFNSTNVIAFKTLHLRHHFSKRPSLIGFRASCQKGRCDPEEHVRWWGRVEQTHTSEQVPPLQCQYELDFDIATGKLPEVWITFYELHAK